MSVFTDFWQNSDLDLQTSFLLAILYLFVSIPSIHEFTIIVYTYDDYQIRRGHQKIPTPPDFGYFSRFSDFELLNGFQSAIFS